MIFIDWQKSVVLYVKSLEKLIDKHLYTLYIIYLVIVIFREIKDKIMNVKYFLVWLSKLKCSVCKGLSN